MTRHHGRLLGAFAIRITSHAQNLKQKALIDESFPALAIAAKLTDRREVMQALGIVYWALETLGVDARATFADAKRIDFPEFNEMLLAFPKRAAEHLDIEVLGQ